MSTPITIALILLALPLFSAIATFALGEKLPQKGAFIGILATIACAALAGDLWLRYLDGGLRFPIEYNVEWFSIGIYPFDVGLLIDGVSLLLLLVVTSVSALVQIYSLGYMKHAQRLRHYYATLSLFTFSMILVVLSNNLLQFFMAWEIMGLCSYLLIGFDYERQSAIRAADKAFLTTRIGDLGLLAALLLIFTRPGTFNFGQMANHLADGNVSSIQAGITALLLFMGTIGKSAQFPLHVWLPDAMEGPTPVSALIHAATMVAAGVLLLARTYGFFLHAPFALEVVAWTGGGTALFAATMALTSTDLKKVLAYSTISQLGLMVMAMGMGGYSAGLYHLITHAAFKALLFLVAGSIIHAVHTNDLTRMGSLSKQMIYTFSAFVVGMLAISGFPFFSGFYSKDMILTVAYESQHRALFVIGSITTFLTAFYMMRAGCLVFLGDTRDRAMFMQAKESPPVMTVPLAILAFFAIFAGWLLKDSVAPLLSWANTWIPGDNIDKVVLAVALGTSFGGLALGLVMYQGDAALAKQLGEIFAPIRRILVNGYYIDDIYRILLIRPLAGLAKGLAWLDLHVLDRWGVDIWAKAIQTLLRGEQAVANTAVAAESSASKPALDGLPEAKPIAQAQQFVGLMIAGLLLLFLWRMN